MMTTGIERKDFFLKHLKDSKWTAGVVLGRCLACKDRGLIANVITGRWHCKICGTRGEMESLARQLGVSFAQGSHSHSETQRAKQSDEVDPTEDPMPLTVSTSSLRTQVNDATLQAPNPELGEFNFAEKSRKIRPLTKGKRIPSDTVQQRQLRRLSPRHLEIVERLLIGQNHKHIAREL